MLSNHLVNEKSKEKKSISGWSFGYICGYMQGSLNVKWSNRYLIETSKEFADLMKILPDNVVSLVKRGMLKNKNKETLRKEFDVYLEKILMTNYTSLMQSYDVMCCPDLTDHLDEHEVVNLDGNQPCNEMESDWISIVRQRL